MIVNKRYLFLGGAGKDGCEKYVEFEVASGQDAPPAPPAPSLPDLACLQQARAYRTEREAEERQEQEAAMQDSQTLVCPHRIVQLA